MSCLKHVEQNLIGNIENKTVLHLQCFNGIDSLSLEILGGTVTGVDISDVAITQAKKLSKELAFNVNFIQSDIYDLPKNLDKQFDIIYTSYGVLSWLHNIEKWGEIISQFLKDGGQLFLIDFHPLANMYADDGKHREYPYFCHKKPLSFVSKIGEVEYNEYIWSHSLSDIINSLLKVEIKIESFIEYPYSTYNCFSFLNKVDEEKYVMSGNLKQPLMYSIKARKITD